MRESWKQLERKDITSRRTIVQIKADCTGETVAARNSEMASLKWGKTSMQNFIYNKTSSNIRAKADILI